MAATDPLRLNGAKITVDKTGAVKVTEPWEVHTEAETITFTPDPTPFGLPVTHREADEFEVGTWNLVLTYEGNSSDGSVSFANENEVEVELDGSMSIDPIKTNPNFAKVKAKFGWAADPENGGKFGFPEFPPNAKSGSGVKAGDAKPVQSELYGVDSWKVVQAIFRISYAVQNAPADVLDHIGEAFNTPPGFHLLGIPEPKGRNWLKLCPKIRRRGKSSRIVLEFELSGPRKVNAYIYTFGQLAR